jgi:hypothetical protein|tara:strand:- start:66 stop:254 length:189 start_codon:yes stop_codon:yes gene_type:complete
MLVEVVEVQDLALLQDQQELEVQELVLQDVVIMVTLGQLTLVVVAVVQEEVVLLVELVDQEL